MMNRILVLDDDPGILEVLDLSLTCYGFRVRPLLSGDNIFRMVKNFEPDLIILDFVLNGPDGAELCRNLKENTATMDIPVIMLSGHPEAQKKAAKSGCDCFVAKPFDLPSLVNRIREIVDQPRPLSA